MRATPKQKPGKCRGCGAPVLWARTRDGAPLMPVDVEPSDAGTVRLFGDGRCHVIPSSELANYRNCNGVELHTSHFATCPKASTFRRPRR